MSPTTPDTPTDLEGGEKVNEVSRMRFTDMASYQRIYQWMGECGDTHVGAGEVIFSTPNMRWPGQVARPGEWIVRTETGFVAEPAGTTDCLRLRDALRAVLDYTGNLWYGRPLSGEYEEAVRHIRGIAGGVRDLLEDE